MATSAPTSMAQNTLPGTAASESVAPPRPAVASRKRVFIVGGVLVAVALAGTYWLHSRQFEETDDAQVDGTISNISPRITGTVTAVHVIENQTVKQGDVIAEIDPTDLEIALDQAKAQVAQAQAQLAAEDPNVSITLTANVSAVSSARSDLTGAEAALSGARNDVQQLSAQIAQAEANDRQAQLEMQRSERLLAQGAVAQADYDQHVNAAAATAANVEAVRQSLAAAKDRVAQQQAQITAFQSRFTEVKSNAPRQVATRTATLSVRQAALELAQAQEAEAEKNLSYAKIVAPVTGIIARKAIAVGDHVAPGQQVVAIAQTDDFWVTANYRETQLELLHAGQPATIRVDALGETLTGSVESVGGATGARLSVLPPENAAGNFVKVVQRIPVRIHFDTGQASMDRLRIGMSVEPQVKVR
jgi:membrane fusion protein (multidrug efflux system)